MSLTKSAESSLQQLRIFAQTITDVKGAYELAQKAMQIWSTHTTLEEQKRQYMESKHQLFSVFSAADIAQKNTPQQEIKLIQDQVQKEFPKTVLESSHNEKGIIECTWKVDIDGQSNIIHVIWKGNHDWADWIITSTGNNGDIAIGPKSYQSYVPMRLRDAVVKLMRRAHILRPQSWTREQLMTNLKNLGYTPYVREYPTGDIMCMGCNFDKGWHFSPEIVTSHDDTLYWMMRVEFTSSASVEGFGYEALWVEILKHDCDADRENTPGFLKSIFST